MVENLAINKISNKAVFITVIPLLNSQELQVFKNIVRILKENNNLIDFKFLQQQHADFTNEIGLKKKSRLCKFSLVLIFILFRPIRIIVWFKRIKLKYQNSLRVFSLLFQRLIFSVNSLISYEVLICWNPYCDQFGLTADIFRFFGKDVFTLEYSPIRGGLMLDKGFIVDSHNLKLFSVNDDSNSINNTSNLKDSKYICSPFLGVNSKKPVVLFLGLCEVDSGVYPNWSKDRRLFYPYFRNGYLGSQKLARSCKDMNFIYKPHPVYNIYPSDEQVLDNLWIINGDLSGLIDSADIVIGNGTKAEMEVLLAGRPLVNFGAGYSYNSGLSFIVNSISEFKCLFINGEILSLEYNNKEIESWRRFLQEVTFHGYCSQI